MKRYLLMVQGTREKVGSSLADQTRTRLATIASLRVTSRRIAGNEKRSISMMMRGLRRVLAIPKLAM